MPAHGSIPFGVVGVFGFSTTLMSDATPSSVVGEDDLVVLAGERSAVERFCDLA